MPTKIKLAILNTHPIQYFAPLYKILAQEDNIDLTVLYCSRWGLDEYNDPQFKTKFKWDIPLLDEYNYKFLKNLRNTEDVNKFFNLINLEVISVLIKKKYDVLWMNGHNSVTNIMAIVSAKLVGTKLLMRAETQLSVQSRRFKKILRKPVMKIFYKMFQGFLYIGTRNKEYYEYLNVDNNKLFFVPYAVDNDFFFQKTENVRPKKSEMIAKYGLTEGYLNILYASKLMKRKNPIHLLKAFQIIKSGLNNVNLVFVGTGEEENNLKEYMRANQIDNVFFLGFVNQRTLPEIFAISDVFVLPSVNEQWGLVINEAMSAGLPIITTDVVGAVPDLVKNGINGYSYSPGNISELAEKLNLILGDEELRITMGTKSREIINDWSYTECIVGIKKALETVVN